MKSKPIGKKDMLARTARFKQLLPGTEAFVDTRLPEYRREIFNVIGEGVTEDAGLGVAISAVEGFNVTYIGAGPGKGAALHSHDTVEVFFAMTGRWALYWGDDGEQEIEMDTLDMISVPAGVMRGFRNIGESHAYMMAIHGATDAGRVTWSPKILKRALETGLVLDAEGYLIERDAESEARIPPRTDTD
ncbi:MAG: cupin domain-containing protein [Gemmatimonadetes bacterium]|nr:cupin domain-containing protein [Gemmatimonadota bacterium]